MENLLLIIGNKNYSSWSLRPWIFLKQMGVAFAEKRIALFTDTTDEALAPYGSDSKVPVLVDGELIIWDSLAILEYVSETYLDGQGWPLDRAARATARSMSAEMHSSFIHVRSEMPMNCRKQFNSLSLSAEAQREVERIQSLWNASRAQFADQGPWLFGDYSIADAMYAPIVMRFHGYSVSVDETVAAYMQHVIQQPALQAWIEAGRQEVEVIDEDEIEQI